ncbi:MAG: phosphopantetheine-binding protein [Bryobacteraceae bacterium]
MSHQHFLERLGEILETEEPLTGAEELKGLEGWDSMAALSFMALADEACGVRVAPKDIPGCITVNDLVALVSARFDDAGNPQRI